VLQQCNQCFLMVPTLTDAAALLQASASLDALHGLEPGTLAASLPRAMEDGLCLDDAGVATAVDLTAAYAARSELSTLMPPSGQLSPRRLAPPQSAPCRFHPGVFAHTRRTGLRLNQLGPAAICPHQHCGMVLHSPHDRQVHPWKCEYRPDLCPMGCGVEVVRRQLLMHLEVTCPLARIVCPNDCGEAPLRSAINDHVGYDCVMTRRPCPRRCGANPTRRDMPAHNLVCPNEPVACEHGCGQGALRAEWRQADHDELCPMAPVHCTHCRWLIEHRKELPAHLESACSALTVLCTRCDVRVSRKARLLEHEPWCNGRRVFGAWAQWAQARAASRREGQTVDSDDSDGGTANSFTTELASRLARVAGRRRQGIALGGTFATLDDDNRYGCGFAGCRHVDLTTMNPRALVRHRSLCPFRPIACQLRCGAWMAGYLLSEHLADECPNRVRKRTDPKGTSPYKY
jgi:hypothetical protein